MIVDELVIGVGISPGASSQGTVVAKKQYDAIIIKKPFSWLWASIGVMAFGGLILLARKQEK